MPISSAASRSAAEVGITPLEPTPEGGGGCRVVWAGVEVTRTDACGRLHAASHYTTRNGARTDGDVVEEGLREPRLGRLLADDDGAQLWRVWVFCRVE